MAKVDPGKIFTDPEVVEPGFEPIMHSIHYPSGGVNVHGLLMMAGGSGQHPLVLLLHGFPGTERNLDIAQALRMAGCHVAFFHYRGAWGSPGDFTFTNVLEDPHNVLDYLMSPAIAEQYRIDTKNVFVVGHSMGGFAALHTGAARSDLRGCCGIAPYDFGKAHLDASANPDQAASYRAVMGQGLPELKTLSDTALLEELDKNAEAWRLEPLADKLAGKEVLLFAFDKDDASTLEQHLEPMKAAYQNKANLQYVQLDTDHSYNDKRVAVAKVLAIWISEAVDK